MINNYKTTFKELQQFFILWPTQSLSTLGSSMTNFALVIWSYQQHGSALITSLLAICSYAPYVILSIFVGALSDRWNKKLTMLWSDSFAAIVTLVVLILILTGKLQIWHLYLINTLNGVMNTVQQPASDVAITLLTPQKHYQKVSGLRSLSNSIVTVLTPVLATMLLSFGNMYLIIMIDLVTFLVAFFSLLFFVKIPIVSNENVIEQSSLIQSAKKGLRYLRDHRGILDLILFLAIVNFTASIFNATLPAMILSRSNGGELSLGLIQSATGIATLIGSILVTVLPAPKSRVRVICNSLLFSMSTENFILAFGSSTLLWCIGAMLGWIFIPFMSANMDALFRSKIPIQMQGLVYSAGNTLQFFTIPLGYLCGGLLVDELFEPFMAAQASTSWWVILFGIGKGSGAALLFCVLGIFGVLTCLPFRASKHIWQLEKD